MDKTAEKLFFETIGLLTAAIEAMDPSLKGRPQLIAGQCVHLAQALGLAADEIKLVYLGGLLHDFGMLYLPRELLGCAPGGPEQDQLASHPGLGCQVLAAFSPLSDCLPIIRHHHEAFDGTGYPDRLKGHAIPVGARIVAVVEAFCDLTNPRAGEALSEEAALDWLKDDPRFDPEILQVLGVLVKAPAQPPAAVAETASLDRVRRTILEIVGRFQTGDVDLPVLPEVIGRIQELIDSPVASVGDLAAVIEQDAVVSGKLISVANSPLYRGAERVVCIGDAVARLGHNETQLVVGTLASRSLYDFDEPSYQELAMNLWQHALATAFLCRLVAMETGLGLGSRYYALGLMHDIGKVLLLHSAAELLKRARNINFDSISIADTITAIDDHHNVFGAALLKRWRFTPVFSEVAEQHDRRQLDGASSIEVRVVALASAMANELGYGARPAAGLDLAALAADYRLSLDQAALEKLTAELRHLMQAALELF